MMDKEIEIRKLELEERRLNAEIENRKEELALQREQFEASQKKGKFVSQVLSPVGVGVIVALIGLLGTALSGLINASTESKKQEASLILKMSEVPDEKLRARNLLFFAEGGYLSFSDKYINSLREKAGLEKGETAPAPMTLVTSSDLRDMSEDQARALATDYTGLPPSLRSILEKSDIKDFSSLRGKDLYDRLDSVQKARLRILYLKMSEIQFPNGRTLSDYITSITALGKDRFTAVPQVGLLEQVNASDKFTTVDSSLHAAPSGYGLDKSVKTKVRPGNVQITFFRSKTKSDDLIIEIDID